MRFLRAVVTMISSILGLGILGLPYVFGQAGYGVSLLQLLCLGVLMGCIFVMYGRITQQVRGHHRFVGYMNIFLGAQGKNVATASFLISMFGGLLPFLILSGTFVEGLFGIDPFFGSLVMWAIGAALIYRGMQSVSRLEVFVIGLLVLLYLTLIFFSLGNFDASNLVFARGGDWGLLRPLGVILFALGGMGAIPEMHDILGRNGKGIGHVIWLGMAIILSLYALFPLAVVGALGSGATEQTLNDLASILPPQIAFLGFVIGSISALSIFTMIGSELMQTIRIDFRLSKGQAWGLTVGLPLLAFLLGVRQLTAVMGFFGSLFGATVGLLVVLAYKRSAQPRGFPNWLCNLIATILVLGAAVEIGYTFTIL